MGDEDYVVSCFEADLALIRKMSANLFKAAVVSFYLENCKMDKSYNVSMSFRATECRESDLSG